jgi:acyl-CoA hydrolase
MILKAMVNHTGRTSMEIGVRVEGENPLTGDIIHTSSAYLTFVGLDERKKPAKVPSLIPGTADEKRRFEEAEKRVAHRRECRRD